MKKLKFLPKTTKAHTSVTVMLLLVLSSCKPNPIPPKKLYPMPHEDHEIEISISGGKSGWLYNYIGEDGVKKAVNDSQILLPASKVIKFSGASNDVIRTCLIRETEQRIDQIPRNLNIESNLKLDIIPGFKNAKIITFRTPMTYTMSCFVDGSIEQLDVVSLVVN